MSTTSTPARDGKRKRPSNAEGTPSVSILDRQLVSRIEKLMAEGVIIPDELSIVDTLQQTYPEYRRKNRKSMKLSVSKALEMIDASIDEELDIDTGHNSMNKSMSDLYIKNNGSSINVNKSKRKRRSEVKEMNSGDREIEKLLKKQVELKEKFMFVPKVSIEDLAGIESTLKQVNRLLNRFRKPELYQNSGLTKQPKGFLIHGPTGVGKSVLVEAIVNDLKTRSCPELTCLKVNAMELVTGITGESESKIRDLFSLASSLDPCIIFIDDVHTITSNKDNGQSRDMQNRMIGQLATCLDSLDSKTKRVMVIGATSRPESLDPSLRRPGRIGRTVCINVPDQNGRLDILKVLMKDVKVVNGFNYTELARNTPGFVAGDLEELIAVAFDECIERKGNESNLDEVNLEMVDFDAARKLVQPAAKTEGFATVPDVTWNEVGALSKIRKELQLSILAPIMYPDEVKSFGMSTSVGILLCGPPGCGKTLLAKAIANESGINFLSVKGPELLKMYVGESERSVRTVFSRAKASKPCILFFDEFDALCKRRGGDSDGGNNVNASVVNQLLTEMDGLESRDCILLAATNRPDILDPAILRPGRFDMTIYVGFPDVNEREDILKALTRNKTRPRCAPDVDLKSIAADPRTEGFTGADLKQLVNEAMKVVFGQKVNSSDPNSVELIVTKDHFEESLRKVRSSVDKVDRDKYQAMARKYSSM